MYYDDIESRDEESWKETRKRSGASLEREFSPALKSEETLKFSNSFLVSLRKTYAKIYDKNFFNFHEDFG